MKTNYLRLLYLCVTFALILAACGPAGEATTVPAEATEAPVSTEPPPPPPAAINLAGPDVGSSMAWADGSLLVYVPPGEFPMGVEGGSDNPLHTVNLDGFWIYQTKVTNRMYALCVGVGICTPPSDPLGVENLEVAARRDNPVVAVNWEQAVAYCGWVKGRLPTEAEWEKVARGPQGSLYPWGDADPTCDLLNYKNCVGEATKVNAYPDSESYYKALDMAGNAYEWVADWYKMRYYADSPGKNPPGADAGTLRSVRGSGFESRADQVPLYRRSFEEPDKFRFNLGFRCVIDAPQILPPYCQTSRIVLSGTPGGQVGGCVSPKVNVESEYCGGKNGFQNINVAGVITSVNSSDLTCSVDGNRIICYGQPSASGLVTICGPCETAGPLVEIGCPPDTSVDGTVCLYDGGPLSGEITVDDSLMFAQTSLGCQLIGTYLDAGAGGCVGQSAPPVCLGGMVYQDNQGCCQAPEDNLYPGCNQSEVADTTQGCIPLVQIEGGNCITHQVTLPTCMAK